MKNTKKILAIVLAGTVLHVACFQHATAMDNIRATNKSQDVVKEVMEQLAKASKNGDLPKVTNLINKYKKVITEYESGYRITWIFCKTVCNETSDKVLRKLLLDNFKDTIKAYYHGHYVAWALRIVAQGNDLEAVTFLLKNFEETISKYESGSYFYPARALELTSNEEIAKILKAKFGKRILELICESGN